MPSHSLSSLVFCMGQHALSEEKVYRLMSYLVALKGFDMDSLICDLSIFLKSFQEAIQTPVHEFS